MSLAGQILHVKNKVENSTIFVLNRQYCRNMALFLTLCLIGDGTASIRDTWGRFFVQAWRTLFAGGDLLYTHPMSAVNLKTRREALGEESFADLANRLSKWDKRRLRHVFSGRWKSLKKEQVEELVGYLDLDGLDDLFRIEKPTVWDPIIQAKGYFALSEMDRSRQPAPSDQRALAHIEDFILSQTQIKAKRDCPENLQTVDELLAKNCLIVGLKRNIAVEVALCRLLGAEPFDTSPDNRERLRVAFSRKKVPGLPPCAIVLPPEDRTDGRSMGGVLLDGEWFLKDEIFSVKDFYLRRLPTGMDGGIVAVARRLIEEQEVLTIIVAGLSSVGTMAGAQILVENYKEVFPDEVGQLAITFFKASYKKRARSIVREPTGKILLDRQIIELSRRERELVLA